MEEIPIISDEETGLHPSLFSENLHSTISSGAARTGCATPATAMGQNGLLLQADATVRCLQHRAEDTAKTVGEITKPLSVSSVTTQLTALGKLLQQKRNLADLPTGQCMRSGCIMKLIHPGRLETLF